MAKAAKVQSADIDKHPPAGAMSLKDRLSLYCSVAALLISSTTFYFTQLHRADDVRVTLPTAPFVTVDEEPLRLAIEPLETVVFINSGNRPAAIMAADLKVDQHRQSGDGCSTTPSDWLEYDVDPFVIKAGEIVSKTMRLKGKRPPEYVGRDMLKVRQDGFVTIPMSDENQKLNKLHVQVCLSITLGTPDNAQETVLIPLYTSDINPQGGYDLETFKGANLKKPKVLLKRTGVRFFSDD